MESLREEFRTGIAQIKASIELHNARDEAFMAKILTAFPGDDPQGHRRYHELMIEKLEETRRLRIAIQEKSISSLVWAAIVLVAIALWHFLVPGIK